FPVRRPYVLLSIGAHLDNHRMRGLRWRVDHGDVGRGRLRRQSARGAKIVWLRGRGRVVVTLRVVVTRDIDRIRVDSGTIITAEVARSAGLVTEAVLPSL